MYSGRELELDLIGKPRWPKEYVTALRGVANEKGYVRRDIGMDLIRRFTPDDPTNPPKDFARELRLAVLEALGLPDGDELGFYSAVGTPVDVFHGVDAWVDLAYTPVGHPDQVRHAVATIDATLRAEKLAEGHKADLIVPDMPSESDPRYLEMIEEYGRELAERIGYQLPGRWHAAPIRAAAAK